MIARLYLLTGIALLSGCNSQSEANASPAVAVTTTGAGGAAALPTKPEQLTPAQRGEIMRAAGYRLLRGEWSQSCDDESRDPDAEYGGEVTELTDLNKDGALEALVVGGSTYCFGMTGSSYAMLTRRNGAWHILTQGTGIPGFYPRPGLAWPDVEVGGPGAHCFPFERWNGTAYEFAGYSVGGKICEIFRPSKITGLTIGYYTPDGEPPNADALVNVFYVGLDRVAHIAGGRFVGLRQSGPNRFIQSEFFSSEEGDGTGDRSETEIVVREDGAFTYGNYGSAYYRVPLDQVPRAARWIDLPEYRSHP